MKEYLELINQKINSFDYSKILDKEDKEKFFILILIRENIDLIKSIDDLEYIIKNYSEIFDNIDNLIKLIFNRFNDDKDYLIDDLIIDFFDELKIDDRDDIFKDDMMVLSNKYFRLLLENIYLRDIR